MVCLFDLYSNTEHYLYFLSISNNNFALLIATDNQFNTIHIQPPFHNYPQQPEKHLGHEWYWNKKQISRWKVNF